MNNQMAPTKSMLSLESLSDYRKELMGFAAIWVALMHSFNQLFPNLKIPVVSKALAYGNLGVEIFLILSGLGLYYSLHKNPDLFGFYKKRLSRLLIPWLVLSFPYWMAYAQIKQNVSIFDLILHYTGLSFWIKGTTTIWYVAFIIPMYAIYPAVFRIQNKNPWYIFVMTAFIVVFSMALLHFAPSYYKKIEIALTRIPVFLMGSHIGCLIVAKKKKPDLQLICYTVISLSLFIAFEIIRAGQGKFIVVLYRYGGGGAMLLLSVVLASLILKLNIRFINHAMALFGVCSLEFYLLNVFVRNITGMLTIGKTANNYIKLLVATAVFAISFLIAFLFSRFHSKLLHNRLKSKER